MTKLNRTQWAILELIERSPVIPDTNEWKLASATIYSLVQSQNIPIELLHWTHPYTNRGELDRETHWCKLTNLGEAVLKYGSCPNA